MPTLNQSAFNQPITDMAVAYAQKAEDGANWPRKLAPVVAQKSKEATYKVFNKGDFFRNEMMRRADMTEAATASYAMSDATTRLEKFALKIGVSDDQKALWPLQKDMDKFHAEFLQNKALISAGILAATNLLTAGVGWGTELVGAASAVPGTSVLGWSLANSTPLVDITDAIDAVRVRIGKKPNRFGVSPDVKKVLRRHSDFTNYTSRGAPVDVRNGVVSMSAMEEILDLPAGSLFEMGTVYNTAAAGQTASMSYIVSETAFIGYVPDSPQTFEASAAYTFTHSTIDGLAADGVVRIDTHRREELKADFYEAELFHDVQLVAADCGYLFTSVLT